MDKEAKQAVIERYVEAFATQDLNIIRDLFATDARVEDPVGTMPHEGIEAIAEFYKGAIGAGAKLELSGNPRYAADSVAFPFQVRMPDMQLEVIDVFEFDDAGKICHMKAYWGPDNVVRT